jgi:hypothetical protein
VSPARRLDDERGTTLVELLVSIMIGIVVLGTLVTIVNVADRGSGRVAASVDANQHARPVMQRIMDELHSTCVTRGLAPVLTGSTGSQIEFIHQTGSAATLTPVKRRITLSGRTMTERVYNSTGGTVPNWTFSSSPSSTRTLLGPDPEGDGGVTSATVNGAVVPLFRYYAYNGLQLSTTPLTTPLTAANAARTVQVDVAFGYEPTSNPTGEDTTTSSLVDSAVLRFAPAGETTTPENLPCV